MPIEAFARSFGFKEPSSIPTIVLAHPEVVTEPTREEWASVDAVATEIKVPSSTILVREIVESETGNAGLIAQVVAEDRDPWVVMKEMIEKAMTPDLATVLPVAGPAITAEQLDSQSRAERFFDIATGGEGVDTFFFRGLGRGIVPLAGASITAAAIAGQYLYRFLTERVGTFGVVESVTTAFVRNSAGAVGARVAVYLGRRLLGVMSDVAFGELKASARTSVRRRLRGRSL